MRAVAVHLEYELRAVCEGACESISIGAPEPIFLEPVEHGDAPRVPESELVGQPAGAVRRVVVDDHDTIAAWLAEDCLDHRLDRIALVVGRYDDGGAH